MRFNATLNVDFGKWNAVKMERDLALQHNRAIEEEIPKFGAGSEYNRDLKEELRRKRFGINPKKFKPESQPWILKTGKNGKKFRGIREGGVGENAAFYVFTNAPDKSIEAYPLNEWYNFQPIQRYKSLTADEAELEFGRRKKVINYFSLMLRKRLKGDEADDGLDEAADEKKPGKAKGKAKELKISDMDEWIDSDDDDSDASSKDGEKEKASDNEEDKQNKKKKKGEEEAKKKKKKRDVDDEAFEESDDGDEEGRELDYISDSSDAVSDLETQVDKEMKGVAEEDALRKLLTSDEDSDEEREKSNDDEEKEEQEKEQRDKDAKEAKEKKKKKAKKLAKGEKKESSSDFSTDSDSDAEPEKKKVKKKEAAGTSRSASPGPESSAASLKRKGQGSSLPSDLTTPDSSNSPVNTPAKKPKMEAVILPSSFSGVVSSNSKDDYGITEEAVRRYLARKPMTTTELLTKFKNKKTGVSSEKLVDTMTQILKRINPVRQTIMNKMYLSIKADK